MEETNYDKLQYDIIRNKHFTMIEWQGKVSIFFDIERLLSMSTKTSPRKQTDYFSRNIFRSFQL